MNIQKLISLNLKQAFTNKSFFIIVIFSISLNTYQYFSNIYLPSQSNKFNKEFLTLSYRWIGFENSTATILFFLMPIISVIVFSNSYLIEKESNFLNGVYTRISKKTYLFAKYISIFIIGGISFILPLLISLILVGSTLPTDPPTNPNSQLIAINLNSMFSDIFFNSPLNYILLYLIIDFLFAGMFAVLSLSISMFIKNTYVVLLFPFLLNTILCVIFEGIGIPQVIPTFLIDPSQPIRGTNPLFIPIEFLLFFSISILIYIWGAKKNEYT
ncbi:hypothetical protein ACFTSE_28675 [Bacillus cereus]|uniref:hypothetical protein n=1 Tax=Bacillus cereus TaxID=1396 RepID=UPI003627471B